jgi:transposase
MRVLRVARSSARKAKNQALNQMRSVVSTAPDEIRAELRGLTIYRLLERAGSYRPAGRTDLINGTKHTLKTLAKRVIALQAEIDEIDAMLADLIEDTAPQLLDRYGFGTESTSAILVAAGDNPGRLRSEASFAHLCGVSPVDASSGKQQRHRLNRGGDRQANAALWQVTMTRMVSDPRTRDYVERRVKEGLTKREAMRCLKRYIAREAYRYLPPTKPTLDSP